MTDSTTPKKPIIAILFGVPLTSQNFERTGIPYLRDSCEVVVLDCNSWLRPESGELHYIKHDYSHIITIRTADEFDNVIKQLKPDFAMDFLAYGFWPHFVQKTLRRHGTKYVIRTLAKLPAPSLRTRTKGRLSMAVNDPMELLARAIAKLSAYLTGWQHLAPDVALIAGKKSLNAFTGSAKTILWVPSMDYYTYKAVEAKSARKELNLPFQGRYMVFLDVSMSATTATATDISLLGLSVPVESEAYSALLREAFDRIERITGLPVVVAGHPNGRHIENYASFFGGRRVYFDITAELCSESELVLSHDSTSVGFAVLWKKPLIFLTSQAIDYSSHGELIREMSMQLECPLLYMESDNDEYESICELGRAVSTEAYKRYFGDFIMTDEVDEVEPWQAFANFVNQGT